ncbi:hypothetical protein CJ483_05045 [Bacillus sp. PK3_68]|nr:hypothetical protein CJ483_05045 [Bacillus sp. PK3_68]
MPTWPTTYFITPPYITTVAVTNIQTMKSTVLLINIFSQVENNFHLQLHLSMADNDFQLYFYFFLFFNFVYSLSISISLIKVHEIREIASHSASLLV